MERFTKSGEINILLTESFLEKCMYYVTSIDSHDTFSILKRKVLSHAARSGHHVQNMKEDGSNLDMAEEDVSFCRGSTRPLFFSFY